MEMMNNMIELLQISKIAAILELSFIVLFFIILVELVIYLFLKIWRL